MIDPSAATVAWASAGHPPALIHTADGQASYLQAGDGLIGIGEPSYRTFTRAVRDSDVLVLYTDGLVERRGESLDAGLDRLERAVRGGPAEPAQLCEHILHEVLPAGERLADDVTALLARISARPVR